MTGVRAGQPDAPRQAGAADIASFLEQLRIERGYSPRTIAAYQADLDPLAGLACERGGAGSAFDWGRIDERAVRSWVARASRDGASPRSIARRLSAWRGFFDWLAEHRGGAGNPARGVRAPRLPKRLPSALAPDQAVRLVADPQAEGFDAVRDRAIAELLYSSGLRLSELISLDIRYFEPASGRPRSASWLSLTEAEVIVTGKGAKRRSVPVGRDALTALRAWLSERERFLTLKSLPDERALFLSRRGQRLSARSVQLRLKRRGIAQGVAASVHPHMLRHSFASHLLQSSGDLRAVQELLGHASIASTQVYTALDFQRLAAVYDAAHPRARRPDPLPATPASGADADVSASSTRSGQGAASSSRVALPARPGRAPRPTDRNPS